MSYLNLPSINMADISKGTISLWFRFSQDSVDAVMAYAEKYMAPDYGDFGIGTEVFRATIPLVTFGRKVMSHTYGTQGHLWTQEMGGATLTATTFDPIVKPDSPCEPSHLGLELNQNDDGYDGTVSLKMRFQTATWATVQGLNTHVTDIHWEPPAGDQYTTVEDASYLNSNEPASFLIKPAFHVAPDQWHHLLVSFDLSSPVNVVAVTPRTFSDDEADDWRATIKSYCKIWYAFDDENKNGQDNIGHDWAPQDQNGIVPTGAKQAAHSYDPDSPNPFVTGGGQNPEYHWAASPVPMNGGPVGLPASSEYVETIYHCELAEFQFFAGVACDTAKKSSRRAFVDEEGTPVDPTTGTEDDPGPGEKLLGKKPDLLLHGSDDWKIGYNTGTLGIKIETDGTITKLPNGQFKPTGGIEQYKPDPVLEDSTA